MNMSFEDFQWHDAVLLSLPVCRERPGVDDRIVLIVRDSDGHVAELSFTDCRALSADMNVGVVAAETIRAARRVSDSEQLRALRARWAALGVDLEPVHCFELNTNSTNSTLRILAVECQVSMHD